MLSFIQKYKYVFLIIFIIVMIIRYQFLRKKPTYDLDKIPKYMINLDCRQDRLKITGGLLNQRGYNNIIRFPAVDGKQLSNLDLNTLVHKDSLQPILENKRNKHHQLSQGAVGCYLSHLKLWEQINQDTNNDIAIIFEDDTKPGMYKSELENQLSHCPDDWDIILFGGNYTAKREPQNNTYFYKVDKFLCLHAYMINKRAINKISSHLYPNKQIQQQIDWTISDLTSQNILNVYAIKDIKSKWYQNSDVYSTDIQTPIVEV